jgi:hAT family C-terminal dimerisation region
MKLVHKKMDHYYSLTNSSNVYRIAMVLHPGMKLEYFCNQKWEEEWIEEAENLVREEYISTYERTTNDADVTPVEDSDANNDGGFASFGDLSVTTVLHESKIQAYLTLPVENVKDPLKWWRANKHIYPNLHHMAQDYISIPGKSCHIIFSA